jgi:hypothetical protein
VVVVLAASFEVVQVAWYAPLTRVRPWAAHKVALLIPVPLMKVTLPCPPVALTVAVKVTAWP